MLREPHTELKNIHSGEDMWVLASGPSMNHIDGSFFNNKLSMGVNGLPNFFNCDYAVSKEAGGFDKLDHNRSKIILSEWSCGNPNGKRNEATFPHYFFTHPDKPSECPKLEVIGSDNIVVSYSTITSAMHLAAYMGCKNIILAGHDCGILDGEVTIKDYHTKVRPVSSLSNLDEYAKWVRGSIQDHTIQVKQKLKDVYGVIIYSLNPFINFGLEGHKYEGAV